MVRYPIKEGAGVPYGFPKGVKVNKQGLVIGFEEVKEEPKKDEAPKK